MAENTVKSVKQLALDTVAKHILGDELKKALDVSQVFQTLHYCDGPAPVLEPAVTGELKVASDVKKSEVVAIEQPTEPKEVKAE